MSCVSHAILLFCEMLFSFLSRVTKNNKIKALLLRARLYYQYSVISIVTIVSTSCMQYKHVFVSDILFLQRKVVARLDDYYTHTKTELLQFFCFINFNMIHKEF